MYTLLSGLYKYMFQKDEYCILILGLDNAGKTVGAYSITKSYSLPYVFFFGNLTPTQDYRLVATSLPKSIQQAEVRVCMYVCESPELPKACGCGGLNFPKAYGCEGIFRKDTRKLL